MPDATVTFDFHNTLFKCDEWFNLEIRTLAAEVLQLHHDGIFPNETYQQAVDSYRAIREHVIRSGIEKDADVCVHETTRAMGLTIEAVTASEHIHTLMENVVPLAQPVEGVIDTINHLRANGVKLGVISSAVFHPYLNWCLRAWEIDTAFDLVTTSASCGIYKSNPEIYRHTMRCLNSELRNGIHIGDSHRFDVESAHLAGMKTVWYTGNQPALTSCTADLVIHTFNDSANDILELLP